MLKRFKTDLMTFIEILHALGYCWYSIFISHTFHSYQNTHAPQIRDLESFIFMRLLIWDMLTVRPVLKFYFLTFNIFHLFNRSYNHFCSNDDSFREWWTSRTYRVLYVRMLSFAFLHQILGVSAIVHFSITEITMRIVVYLTV